VIILFSTFLYRHFNLGNLERFGINEDENEEGPRLSRGVDHFCPIDVVLGYSRNKLTKGIKALVKQTQSSHEAWNVGLSRRLS
jgi:hypothetical protein